MTTKLALPELVPQGSRDLPRGAVAAPLAKRTVRGSTGRGVGTRGLLWGFVRASCALALLGDLACSGNSRSQTATDAHPDGTLDAGSGGRGTGGHGTGGGGTGGGGTGGSGTGGGGTGGASGSGGVPATGGTTGSGGAATGGCGDCDAGATGGTGGDPDGGGEVDAGSGGAGGLAGGAGGGGGDATATGGAGGSPCPPVAPAAPSAAMNVSFVSGVTVSTLAGSGTSGSLDGDGSAASFDNPVSVALAPGGNLFVAAYDGNQIRQVTPTGTVTTTIAGGIFRQPFGLVAASDAFLYVDTDVSPQGAKSSQSGTIWRVDVVNHTATVAKESLGRPRGVAALLDGRLVLADFYNNLLLVLDPVTGVASPLAGDRCPGYADGNGGAARFNTPYGLAVRGDGAIVVADLGNHRLRLVRLDGTVETLAGDGTVGMVDGAVAQATFNQPKDVAIDAAGAIYISDSGNHRIRRLLGGQVQTLAGDGVAGFQDGSGAVAELFGQEGLDVTPDGRKVYVADGNSGVTGPYHRVRAIAIPSP